MAITQRRTRQDFAHQMRWLVDEAYPEVQLVRVVLDSLNTHRHYSLLLKWPRVWPGDGSPSSVITTRERASL